MKARPGESMPRARKSTALVPSSDLRTVRWIAESSYLTASRHVNGSKSKRRLPSWRLISSVAISVGQALFDKRGSTVVVRRELVQDVIRVQVTQSIGRVHVDMRGIVRQLQAEE